MAMISFHCPGCHKVLKTTNPELTGRQIRCPGCGHAFAMPTAAERDALELALQPALPTAQVIEGDVDEAAAASSSPQRRRRIFAAYAICAVVVFLATSVGGYVVWDRVVHGTRNNGRGDENALAFVPADSNVVLRFDTEAWSNHPEVRRQMEQYVRSLGNSPFFFDWQRATGLEFADMFGQLTYALRMPTAGVNAGRRPLATTLIIRSRVPFQQHKIAKAFPNALAERIHGQTVFRVNEPMFQTLYMPSDRTIVLTNIAPVQLPTLLEAEATESRLPMDMQPLSARVAEQPFWVAMAFDGTATPEMHKSIESLRSVSPLEWQPLLEALPASRSVALWATPGEKERVQVKAGLVCANELAASNVAQAFGELAKASSLRKSGYTAILSRTSFLASFRQFGSALIQEGEFSSEHELAIGAASVETRTLRLLLRDLHRNLGLRRPEMMPTTPPFMPFPNAEELMPQDEPR